MAQPPLSSDLSVALIRMPLSPLLFLLVVESLNRIIHKESSSANLKGIKININFSLTHLLFVDDILIFCEGNISYITLLKVILQTFCIATGMQINMEKSSLYTSGNVRK
jgi:hypothetical protein